MVNIPNTNLLLIVGGVIAAVFLVNEVRKAGGDLSKALEGIKFPSIGDIKFPDFKFPDIKFPEFNFPEFPSFEFPDFTKFFEEQQKNFDEFTATVTQQFSNLGEAGREVGSTPDPDVIPQFGGGLAEKRGEQEETISPEQEAFEAIPAGEDISGAELASAINAEEFRRRQEEQKALEERALRDLEIGLERPSPIEVVSELPTEQIFGGGGLGFIGGIIRENPIDTLGEVIDLFPELSASQAADFLAEFSGISPTDALRIDPDIKNIVANIGGENIQVVNVSPSDLEAENIRAAKVTCEQFGLNCELAASTLA